jgi:hypothetical protein
MKEIILNSKQRMLSPDQLAYELGQIPIPQEIENSKKTTYIIFGMLFTVSIGLLAYNLHKIHQENKSKKIN